MTAATTAAFETVDIALPTDGLARDYPVLIGPELLDVAGGHLKPLLSRPFTVVITDENVYEAQGARLSVALKAENIAHEFIVLPPGESTKSFAALADLSSRLLALGVERRDLIIAFGGGVIGDLVGLAAGLLRRGCRFAQIPTTLLAQVDSSVGGKTAVNTPEGKNLIGLFHQPSIVLADMNALSTLSDREMRAGYAEVVKYGALGDAPFFAWLEDNGSDVLARAPGQLAHAVATSVKAKAAIVAADEREKGARALLNLGHTFGHALEAAFGYSGALLHGEAVGAGMGLAFDYSAHEGLCSKDDAARVKRHLAASGLPTGLHDLPEKRDWRASELITLMGQDKKVEDGALTLILADAIGAARIVKAVDPARLEAFLKTQGAQ
ncbi:MAG: 3-dehydroquinate synthase [Pseudomonadota bacterium]